MSKKYENLDCKMDFYFSKEQKELMSTWNRRGGVNFFRGEEFTEAVKSGTKYHNNFGDAKLIGSGYMKDCEHNPN